MNSIKNIAMAGIVVVSTLSTAPAFARHHDNDWDDHDHHHHGNNWNNRYNNNRNWRGNGWNNNDWNSQRTMYRNNWNHISMQRQRDLDAQMRAQWLAYHNNNYNGQYNWGMYNDPRFLDYLHTRNPGLLGSLRNALGL